jgi:predicted amidohydrolase YtcJ
MYLEFSITILGYLQHSPFPLEDKLGSIEPGKLADLAVLDKDILTCPVDDIKKTKVLTTMINGKVVYGGF